MKRIALFPFWCWLPLGSSHHALAGAHQSGPLGQLVPSGL
jgi:hypothetical protein